MKIAELLPLKVYLFALKKKLVNMPDVKANADLIYCNPSKPEY